MQVQLVFLTFITWTKSSYYNDKKQKISVKKEKLTKSQNAQKCYQTIILFLHWALAVTECFNSGLVIFKVCILKEIQTIWIEMKFT